MFVMCAIRHAVTRHKCKHSWERHYVCDVCNKAYSYKSGLINHKCVHSGESPYVCGVCNKAYSDKSNLIKHIFKHNGDCSYVCVWVIRHTVT